MVIGKEPYKYSEYQNFENQYSLSVDDKPNQWYNENNSTRVGSYWVAKELLGKADNGDRKNYQPDFAIYGEDNGLIFSDYPYHIPYGKYYISAEVESGIEYGDKVFISWKGSTPVVMNKVIDTEEVFEEDEEDNEYMVKIKDNEIEAILEKCVQKENKVYVSLEEILKVYDKVDNDNLSWEAKEIPYYSYGSAFNILRVERKVFGNSVGLDLVVPRRNENDYGELENISYNSLLGSKETVNIPVLWVDDEVYVLIDGFYKAMGELLIKPIVKGNMDKIPIYIYNSIIIEDNLEEITTSNIYVENGEDKKYFSKIYRKYDDFYVLKSELEEYFNNSLTISVNNESKHKIINRGYGAVFYKNENNSNQEIMLLSENSNKKVICYGPELQKDNESFVGINSMRNANEIKNKRIILKAFSERMSNQIEMKFVAFTFGANLTIAYIKRNLGKYDGYLIFCANSNGIKDDKKTQISEAELIKLLKNREDKVNKKYCIIYNEEILKDGSMSVAAADLEVENFFNDSEKKQIGHFAGDMFNSFDTALEMLKTYYSLDNNYIKNKDKSYMGFAIYCDYTKKGKFSYSGAVEYKTLLSLQYVGGDNKKSIWGYFFPDVIKITMEELKRYYDYPNRLLYYKDIIGPYKKLIISSKPIVVDDWLRLYEKPTVKAQGRCVYKHPKAEDAWAMYEGQEALNGWALKDMKSRGIKVVAKIGKEGEIYDENGRYWIAVGPNVMNPNHKPNEGVNIPEMKYGTKIDIVVKDKKNNNTLYIAARISETKEHTWPEGLYQTGKKFPNGELSAINADGSTVEFVGFAFAAANYYSLEKLIIYDNII